MASPAEADATVHEATMARGDCSMAAGRGDVQLLCVGVGVPFSSVVETEPLETCGVTEGPVHGVTGAP